ncbi:MAG: hypothetical protein II921_05610 [Treponema sp.]|nr:hypothetical protein [Treponema sp.]
MKTVALVPVKLNNERTPGKNTKRFDDGTPLMHFIQRTLLSCAEVDEVYVYCSRDEVKPYLLDGVRFLRRDACFDTASANVNEMFLAFSNEVDADIYVLAHATAPFQRAESIANAVRMVKSGEYDSAVAVRKMQDFLWIDGKPFNYEPSRIPRTQDLKPFFVETTGMYVFTKSVIQSLHRRIGDKPYLQEMDEIESVDINMPVDFEIANAIHSVIFGGAHVKTADE